MKNQAFTRRNPQSGNVLLIVLIGIVLFAAFSYAVSKGMKGGVSSVDEQKAKLAATEIVEYLNKYKSAFDMLLINGCDPLKIDFSTPYYLRANGTPLDAAPPGTSEECGIYTQAGGNLSPVIFENYKGTSYTPAATDPRAGHGHARYSDLGLGTEANDLRFGFSGMDKKICLEVLNLFKETSDRFETMPEDTWTNGGTNSYTTGTAGSLDPIQMPVKSKIFSLSGTGSSNCHIFLVLKAN